MHNHEDFDLWADDLRMDVDMTDEDDPQSFNQDEDSLLETDNDDADEVETRIEEDSDSDSEIDSRATAIANIEGLVLSFLTQLNLSLRATSKKEGNEENSQRSRRAKVQKIELQFADRKKVTADGSMGTRIMRFPKHAKPFAQLFRVLEFTHEALVTDVPATKRDIYYKDVPLFQKQGIVDRLIDDLAATFEMERSDLNVRATSKGLVCGGGLLMHLKNGERIYANDSEGALIPVGEDISRFEVDEDIAWVLIVEKEAVFQTLCRLNLASHPYLPGPGIVITGKGYPDVATRQLVKALSDNLPPHIPILALVDGDAYGLDILSVYKNGSASMRHENGKLAAERVEWIGVWASELAALNIDRDALIRITAHDEQKAYAMLRRDLSSMPSQWRKELQHMLHTRRKAEIEILSTAKPLPPPAQEMPKWSSSVSGAPPLLEYLLEKILAFVDACADA